MPRNPAVDWAAVQANPTYLADSIDAGTGLAIRWHSPGDPRSSQVFCISAFCTLRQLPDRDSILGALFREKLPHIHVDAPWTLVPEHTEPGLLGETGQGMPTNVDIYCRSARAVVCIESKFIYDAAEGFGGCGQVTVKDGKQACAGFYGRGSDLRTKNPAPCRLSVLEGRRAPRNYWTVGRPYFLPNIFVEQIEGQECHFKGPHFQLMRNFLFAATSATQKDAFGVLAIVPEKRSARVRSQITSFQRSILRSEYRGHVGVATYEDLVAVLAKSDSERGRRLGEFLSEKVATVANS